MREWAVFLPLLVLVFWIGIYPKPYFDILDKSVETIVQRVNPAGLIRSAPAAAQGIVVRPGQTGALQ
jgi:NADH:ubiquinone oxidoreductase subunit 4 (subunit M)